jgi:hypothetical protein
MLEVTISVNDGPRTVSVVCRVPLKGDEFSATRESTIKATLDKACDSVLRVINAGGERAK